MPMCCVSVLCVLALDTTEALVLGTQKQNYYGNGIMFFFFLNACFECFGGFSAFTFFFTFWHAGETCTNLMSMFIKPC